MLGQAVLDLREKEVQLGEHLVCSSYTDRQTSVNGNYAFKEDEVLSILGCLSTFGVVVLEHKAACKWIDC